MVILGNPGAGKTTSMKFICHKLLYDEEFLKGTLNIPIVIRLRDLKVSTSFQDSKEVEYVESIFYHIYELLGIRIEINSKNQTYIINSSNYLNHEKFLENIVISLLDEMKVLLILDGLDEITTIHKKQIIKEIRILTLNLNQSKLIITCRTGEYNYNIANTQVYEICELDDSQIKLFIQKWFSDKEIAKKVYSEIIDSPFRDTLAKPLTIAHLCAIYERYGRIPEKPKTLYKKIVTLLIEEWDSQRSIKRKSQYANFDTDRKYDFLCNLAYYLTTELERITFTKEEFKIAYKATCVNFNLPILESEKVALELESHTGLFLQTGYEEFEFAHKSIQEYLCAEYIVRLPQIPFSKSLLYKLPNECALAVAISSNPTNYFSSLLLINLQIGNSVNLEFTKTFLSRLVIEKPDFVINAILGVAVLVLAEQLNSSRISYNLNTILEIPQVKKSLKLVLEYYKIGSDSTIDNKEFVCLVNHKSIINEVTSYLPKLIIAKKRIIEGLRNA